MISSKDTVLLLAPHADDIEFSCGASVNKWCEAGADVWYISFSPCNQSIPEHLPENILYEELSASVKHLGIKEDHVITYDIPVRNFNLHRQEILDIMIQLKKKIDPNWVVLPNSNDIHQDHKQIHEEGLRAFKHCSILGFELVWNNFIFNSNCHSIVDKKHIDSKIASIKEYKSQGFRRYSDPDYVFGHARVRGQLVKSDFAECFELIHMVL